MNVLIELAPITQTGHNCKPTAIAAVEQYFSEQLHFKPIPLHKNKTEPLSIRKLAKKHKSCQGELLEVRQLSEIFDELGYATELVDFQDNLDSFKQSVIQNITKGNLLIGFFAVDRRTGDPLSCYEQDNEHAAVLHGFTQSTGELNITHWDKNRKTSMENFYDSSMVLPDQRKPEYYVKDKPIGKKKKYDLYHDQTGENLPKKYKKSLVPTSNSGFRGKLLVIKRPNNEKMLEARKKITLQGKSAESRIRSNSLNCKDNSPNAESFICEKTTGIPKDPKISGYIKSDIIAHHKVLMGIGFTLVLLGLVAATTGVLGLIAGLLVLSAAMAKGLAMVGGTVGIGLCAAGGSAASLGGVLAGMGLYGKFEKNKVINYLPNTPRF